MIGFLLHLDTVQVSFDLLHLVGNSFRTYTNIDIFTAILLFIITIIVIGLQLHRL